MKKYIIFGLKVIAAFIMLQTLIFKFTGAQESVDLFTQIAGKNEAMMRIGTGILELFASIALFIPSKTWVGALLALGVMGGAILTHLNIIGIEHNNDGGALFFSAVTTFIISAILLFINKKDIPILGKKFSQS